MSSTQVVHWLVVQAETHPTLAACALVVAVTALTADAVYGFAALYRRWFT